MPEAEESVVLVLCMGVRPVMYSVSEALSSLLTNSIVMSSPTSGMTATVY